MKNRTLWVIVALILVAGIAAWWDSQPKTSSSWKTVTIPVLHMSVSVPEDWGRFDGSSDMVTLGSKEELSSVAGSSIFIQETSSGWYSSKPPYAYGLDGTQASFDALRAMPDGAQLKDSSKSTVVKKVGNSNVSGYNAVTISRLGGPENTDSPINDNIIWVKSGDMNWYIDISDFKPDMYKATFDQVVASVHLMQ